MHNTHPSPTAAALPPTPRLSSAVNFRDVAGDGSGYPTREGHAMARGVVYRSDVLTLSNADFATLSGLGIAHVYDLRRPDEASREPDRVPAGAVYTNINFLDDPAVRAAMSAVTNAAQAEQYLVDANRAMVSDVRARAALRQVLVGIENAIGPAIIHCAGGKDRTGFVAAILQSIAGVPHEDVMRDYLLTNERTKAQMDAALARLAQEQGQEAAAAFAPVVRTEPRFLQAAFDQIDETYGSVTTFLTEGAGLMNHDIARLKAKLTV